MDRLEGVSLVGEIDATQMLRITQLAQELGLLVIDLVQEKSQTMTVADAVVPGPIQSESLNPLYKVITRTDFSEFARGIIIPTGQSMEDMRGALGAATRTYVGLMDMRDKSVEDSLGVKSPTFHQLVMRPQSTKDKHENRRQSVDTKKTSNLDTRETAEYLIAAHNKIQHLCPTDNVNDPSVKHQLNEFLPDNNSWLGMVVLSRYVGFKGELPDEVTERLMEAIDHYQRLLDKNPGKITVK